MVIAHQPRIIADDGLQIDDQLEFARLQHRQIGWLCALEDETDTRVLVKKVTPVTLPPGRLMLATRPSETGSLPLANTIGMVAVAAFAAWAEFAVPNAPN